MARSLLDDTRFRLQFAGHETFPLRYGWLKKSFDAIVAAETAGSADTRAIFTDDFAIAYFGVGKNMVTSMRHWSLASGVLQITTDDDLPSAGGGQLKTTPLGRLLLSDAGDPYLERPASLWLLHWHLAATPGRAAVWYWAFNELNEPTFTREVVRTRLGRRCDELREGGRLKTSRITESTLKSDVLCFIRTYAAKSDGRSTQEDALECPLTELRLVQTVEVGSAFQFRRGPKSTLPDEVFLYGLLRFWRTLYPTRRELTVETVAHEPGSPGRVFLLDEETVAERLARLSDLTRGAVRWDESTGMRQVYAANVMRLDPLLFLDRLYRARTDTRSQREIKAA